MEIYFLCKKGYKNCKFLSLCLWNFNNFCKISEFLTPWLSCKAHKCWKSKDLLVQVAYNAHKFYSSREKCWRNKSLSYSSFINATGVISLLGVPDPSQNKIKEGNLLVLKYEYILLSSSFLSPELKNISCTGEKKFCLSDFLHKNKRRFHLKSK